MNENAETFDRDTIIDQVVQYTCTRNCMGQSNNAAGCCTIGDRDYIIGPIPDAEALFTRLNDSRSDPLAWEEVFIEEDEGKALFPEKPIWQRSESYPALRLDMDDASRPCQFLGQNNLCTIHSIRSETCRNYQCSFVDELIEKF